MRESSPHRSVVAMQRQASYWPTLIARLDVKVVHSLYVQMMDAGRERLTAGLTYVWVKHLPDLFPIRLSHPASSSCCQHGLVHFSLESAKDEGLLLDTERDKFSNRIMSLEVISTGVVVSILQRR